MTAVIIRLNYLVTFLALSPGSSFPFLTFLHVTVVYVCENSMHEEMEPIFINMLEVI